MMNITFENTEESRDFGKNHSLKIEAFEPREIFRLAIILKECADKGLEIVYGETGDKSGMFIRIPLIEPVPISVEPSGSDFFGVDENVSEDTLVEVENKCIDRLSVKNEVKNHKEPQDKFFLEISGRQTGKTTRLCAEAAKHGLVGDVVIYVVNARQAKRIMDVLKPFNLPNRLIICRKKWEEPDNLINPRRFFDEWDFIEDCPYDENGYYCSTLRNLRRKEDTQGNNLFGKLWRRANGGMIHKTSVSKQCFSDVERGEIFEKVDEKDRGNISDGYHIFNELYDHRHALTLSLMKAYPDKSWYSHHHHDKSRVEGYFIIGIETPQGDMTYHIPCTHIPYARKTGATFLPYAKKWDGHTSQDVVDRLLNSI